MMRYTSASVLVGLLAIAGGLARSQEAFQSPYFPLEVGNEWHYRSGDEKVIIRVVRHEPVELMDDKEKPSKIQAAVVELKSGNRIVFEKMTVAADGAYRLSTAGHQITPPLRFLKLPSKEGDKWTVQSDSEGIPLKGTFTISRETVKVPAGSFDCYVSATKDFQIAGDTSSITYWFAENVGMVKQRVQVGNFDRLLELEKFVIKK